jgi:hypothetical protein
MSDRLLDYPDEYQEYLRAKFGARPFHPRHLKRLEDKGERPKPTYISERRRAILQSVADRVGQSLIAAAGGMVDDAYAEAKLAQK